MSRILTDIIAEQTELFFHNIKTALQTCDMDCVLCDMPIWKHVYHMLHSVDQWFINPARFDEPPFHEPGLNSLDAHSGKTLSREELLSYYNSIREKTLCWIATLTDERLPEKPEGCEYTNLAKILGQYRHAYAHLGNINCTTILKTGRWPLVAGLDRPITDELYE
ncbi:MAG: hypothetical protein LBT12_08765 [Oscillospiraceae bacterium]|jgi:hypothetical protein|nr:hypothetical protein [Oscillospiraceae bacterium]